MAGRGIRPWNLNTQTSLNKLPNSNEITAQDRLNFFGLGEGRTFTVPSTATGGMGLVLPRVVDNSDTERRECDRDYARGYQERELERMKRTREPDCATSTPTNQSQKTPASQLDEIEEASFAGEIPSLKSLDEDEYRALYTRFSSTFQTGRFDTSLIIAGFKPEILKIVRSRNAVIIAGSTGCGKTTQVPQYILDDHFHRKLPCRIVVTQPRRIAAQSVAARVAHEMGVQIGTLVGYQIGMDKKTSPDTCLTYVTTGILLQKFIANKNMNDYTHVIIDEIHERDQDTDFLMLIVRKFLRTNSTNVKVILMSATIDTGIYSEYFSRLSRGKLEPAFVLDIEGKPTPVTEFYLDSLCNLGRIPNLDHMEPNIPPESYSLAYKLVRAFDRIEVTEANSQPSDNQNRGTVLIFLPGYEHIIEMKKALIQGNIHEEKKWWILPLHSSITREEQNSVFKMPQPGYRKIILSTNIAESSITVKDIKYVIDFCLTKNLVRDRNTNYVSLQLEWAAKANCNQRRGRAGRVSSGRVYRLVSEMFYSGLKDYATPEMKRCPLELVILQAKKLEFDEPKGVLALSLDPPNIVDIEKSILALKEVGALALTSNGVYTPYDGDLTFIGHVMSRLPLDAKISKLILLGHVFDCLDDCIIIAACLSTMNFFSSPFEKVMESYKAKLSWANNTFSDCIAYWEAYSMWAKFRATNQFHRPGGLPEPQWAKKNFLQLNRLHEVDFLIEDIKKRLAPLGIKNSYLLNQAPQTSSDKEKKFILSICMCGAFYPNYFLQSETDERLVYRELSKKNPLNTVYLSGLPSNQGILYERQIIKLFDGVSQHIQLEFDGSKALVEFTKPDSTQKNTQGIHRAVYLAMKLCHEKSRPMQITIYHPDEAKSKVHQIELMKKAKTDERRQLNTNRITLIPEIMPIKKATLPGIGCVVMKLLITEINNCGYFWAQNKDELCQQQLSKLETTINMEKGLNLNPITRVPIDSLVLAPFKINGETMYHRCRVDRVNDVKAKVFYLDYGNSCDIKIEDLREFDEHLDEDMLKIPIQSYRCRLACIKPAFRLDTLPGEWSKKANVFFKQKVEGQDLIARIYSEVDQIVNLELYRREPDGQEISINNELIRAGFAIDCEEPYLSKNDHEARLAFEQMSEEQQQTFGRSREEEKEFVYLQFNDTLNLNRSNKTIRLSGPYSPLQSTFYGISKISYHKRVMVERNSINSITLDAEPHSHQDRLLIASYVSLNSKGDVMNARNTTLMPPINGLPAIMMLLFTPAMELRRNCLKTKHIGAICGLGCDPNTNKSYYPDHDSEIVFDTEIDQEDIVKINFLRTCINLVLGDAEKYSVTNTNSLSYFRDIRESAQTAVQDLLRRPRKPQERMDFSEPYIWGRIPKDDLVDITHLDKSIELDETVKLLPMHKGVILNIPIDETIEEKRMELKRLHSRARTCDLPEFNQCILCKVNSKTPSELMRHLNSPFHIQAEQYILNQ